MNHGKYKLLVLFKIKSIDNTYRTLSLLQILNFEEIDKLTPLFIEYWNLRTEDYFLNEISDMVIYYKIVDTSLETKLLKPKSRSNFNEDIKIRKFGGYSLPTTMDFTLWGRCHFVSDKEVIVFKKSSKLEYHIQLFDKHQEVDLRLDDTILLSFKDTMNDKEDLSTFTRSLKNQKYIFKEGILCLKMIEKISQFLKKVGASMYLSRKFITMDLETRVIEEKMSSYCVSLYDGIIKKSFYLTDFLNEKEMLKASIKFLMRRKYHNHKIYLHNFSKFDAVFLLARMTELSDKIFPLIRDGRYINLRFEFSEFYKLYFRDSLLMLPASLRSLAKNFGVENKGIFPYKFVNNKAVPLDYIGKVPDFCYFDNITQEEYKEYCKEFLNKSWNLREQTIKYCEQDCLVLYQILDQFSKNIFAKFRIDVFKYPTLSSLAFAIFRANFLKEYQIPLIHGEIYNFIKKAYTGGNVDVYKPTPTSIPHPTLPSADAPATVYEVEKKKIFSYDVNSLYPYAMKSYPMPVGNPIYFEGDILIQGNVVNKSLSNQSKITGPQLGEAKPFGIFEVEIETPDDLKIPLLQTKVKTKKGYRTITPLGHWTGHYFSDELYNAAKFGYKFKVLRGYLFKRGDVFSGYVDTLYEWKKKSPKGSPEYLLSKLLLNSLYGRLGMNPICDQHEIVSNEESLKLYSKFDVKDIIDFQNGKELITHINKPYTTDTTERNFDIKNISIVVSAIVTASARIHMTQFKTIKNLTIYYTDTDSIATDKELDPKFIGDDLGMMKLEHTFDDAVFLAPKMYGGKEGIYEHIRIRGVKIPIKFEELKKLLHKDCNLEIKQEKWYRDLSLSLFNVKDEIYTLMVTDSKRKLLYNEENIFYDTEPLRLENGKLVE